MRVLPVSEARGGRGARYAVHQSRAVKMLRCGRSACKHGIDRSRVSCTRKAPFVPHLMRLCTAASERPVGRAATKVTPSMGSMAGDDTLQGCEAKRPPGVRRGAGLVAQADSLPAPALLPGAAAGLA
jgi:hypothetical protein